MGDDYDRALLLTFLGWYENAHACASYDLQLLAARPEDVDAFLASCPRQSAPRPATFTHAEAHTICGLLTEADEESERGMPSGLDPEVRGNVGHLMAKVWAANTERKS
jgi:hypothetical protein